MRATLNAVTASTTAALLFQASMIPQGLKLPARACKPDVGHAALFNPEQIGLQAYSAVKIAIKAVAVLQKVHLEGLRLRDLVDRSSKLAFNGEPYSAPR